MEVDPRVSVVIPVRDRREGLHATLDALAHQTFSDFEVVVTDDGSTDGSGDVAHAKRDELAVEVVGGSQQGAVKARMTAIARARGDVLAFTDSDCVPDREWLERGIAAIDKGADLVVGKTIPERELEALERSVAQADDGLFATCNLFVTREAYDRAGGFRPDDASRMRFRPGVNGRGLGFGEDTLFGWRAVRCGARIGFASDAVVRHAVARPPTSELFWRAWLAGGFPALVRDVPELSGTLLAQGVFLTYRRAPLYAAVLAAILGRRRAAAVLAGAWIGDRALRTLRDRGPLRRRLAAVPIEIALDVVTAVALVAGSVRARRIVV